MFKVIQVGIGNMGGAWLSAVQNSQEVEFAGFVEINPDFIEQQSAKFQLNKSLMFPSLEAALATVQADAILDITPPGIRPSVAQTAFAHKLPVLAEKPLADRFEVAQAIVQGAADHGVLYGVAQNYRYGAAIQTLKSVLENGELGEIGFITVEFYKGPVFGGFRAEMSHPLIMDMSIHHFDLMRFLTDREPLWIHGQSWRPAWGWNRGEDSASLTLEFEGGIVVHYVGSWATTAKPTTWNGTWRIECENGVAWLEDDQVFMQKRVAPNTDPASTIAVPLLTPEHVSQDYLLHEFYESVALGKPFITTGQDNLHSLAMVFKTLESFQTGQRVRV
jgi:predicted dehydrogenase